MKFPKILDGFERSNMHQFDVTGMDVSAGYDSADSLVPLAITVYVYPSPPVVSVGSPQNVIDGARRRIFEEWFEREKREILGAHSGSTVVHEGEFSLEQDGKLHTGMSAVFELEDIFGGKRQSLRSHLYLFGYVGGEWTIKYRVTHPRDFDANGTIIRFMKDLTWTIDESN